MRYVSVIKFERAEGGIYTRKCSRSGKFHASSEVKTEAAIR